MCVFMFRLQWLKRNVILLKVWGESMKILYQLPFSYVVLPCSYVISSFSNVENVRVPNMSNIDVSQLDVLKAQVVAWRPHSCMFICWGFFVIHNGLLMELVKSQVLQCISCRSEQVCNDVLVSNDVLAHISILCKGLIKYNKINGITPIITHVQTAHLKLFAEKK